jgi:MarR family transcriptional regulator, transcriptional regulator for hemolysin
MTAERTPGHLLNHAARLFRRLADRRLAPLGLSAAHLPVITALIHSESLSQRALTDSADVEQSTMAATLSRMERDRIIERYPDPADGRSTLFSLTAATKRKVPQLEETIRFFSEEALAQLTVQERRRSRRTLQRLIVTLEQILTNE